MKSINYMVCLFIGLFVVTTAESYTRPTPPAGCKIANPKHVSIYMHGAYIIEASTSLNCFNRNQVAK